MTVDYGRAVRAKHELQIALDTAVLASGSLKSESEQERVQLGKAIFETIFDTSGRRINEPKELTIIRNDVVTANQSLGTNTRFFQILGLADGDGSPKNQFIEIQISATAKAPQVARAAIALMLDDSGSIGDELGGATKYITVRDAAKDLISSLLTNVENADRIQFSLVPFSYGAKAKLTGKKSD